MSAPIRAAAPVASVIVPCRAAPAAPGRFAAVLARAPAPARAPSPSPSLLARVAGSIEARERRLDGALRAAQSGRTMSGQELLALQVEVQRYSEEVDLCSRVVDKATSAVKQMLGTQV